MRSAFAILTTVVAVAGLTACGESESGHTPVTPASDFSSPGDGIVLRAPKGATIDRGKDQQVVVLRRGESTLTISRFERPGEDLPDSQRELQRAARALVGEYTRRDQAGGAGGTPQSGTATIGGHDAVVIDLKTRDKSIKHVHFYDYGAEIVVDMVAPTADAGKARFTLFDPVLSTLTITRPQD